MKEQIIKPFLSFADQFVLAVSKSMRVITFLAIGASFVFILAAAWVFTEKLRFLLDNTLLSILAYLAALGIMMALGKLSQKIFQPLIVGKPVFGVLEGFPRRGFATSLRARAQIKIELYKADQPRIKLFNIIQMKLLQETLKARFYKIKKAGNHPEEDLEKTWADVWENQILGLTIDGQTLKEVADVNKFGFNYALSAVNRGTSFFPHIFIMFWIAVMILIYLFAGQKLELLTGIQIGIVFSFILAAFWYMFVLQNLNVFTLSFLGAPVPEKVQEEFADEIGSLEGKEVHLKKIHVEDKFYNIIRNYQTWVIAGSILSDFFSLLPVIGLSYGLIYLINADYASSVSDFHLILTYGFLVAGITLVASFYFFSIIIQNFKNLRATFIIALFTAAFPFLFEFLLSGEMDISGLKATIFAGTGGITGALITTITSRLKESLD